MAHNAIDFCHNRDMTKESSVRVLRPRRATLRKARALAEAVDSAQLPVLMPGMRELARARERAHALLSVHIIPRCEALAMPLVVVIAGSSGVGKSALSNALAGENVCEVSALRPTTTEPMALVSAANVQTLTVHPLASIASVQGVPTLAQEIALVDSPSFDYSNPELEKSARALLDMAQAVVFVTTAHRYGDGAAWDVLMQLRQRNLPVLAVLNRVPLDTDGKAEKDFRRLWSLAGYDPDAVVVVKEGELGIAGGPAVTLWQHAGFDSETLWGWINAQAERSHSDGRKYRRRRDDADALAVQELSRDVEVIANGLDSARNAIVDLADKAREGAAGPFDKLSVNISMARFGQGAPSALWEGLVAPEGVLNKVADIGKKAAKGKLQAARDAQLTQLFATVLTSVSIALLQGLTTAQGNIERLWENDAVDTTQFAQRGRAAVDVHAVSRTALQHWKGDVASLARRAHQPQWVGFPGKAGLIGVAASGVGGAMDLARQCGLEQTVWDARAALTERVSEAMENLVKAYSEGLDAVAVPESRILREALHDFVEAFQGGE